MVKVQQDLTGMVFGKWTVLERADDYVDPHGHKSAMWKCQCSCDKHTIKNVVGTTLKDGSSKSCGCAKHENKAENLIGQKFGMLTVVSRADDFITAKGKHKVRWNCVCECGKETVAYPIKLKKGLKKTCGNHLNGEFEKRNKHKHCGSYTILYATDGRKIYVDREDYDKISNRRWSFNAQGYVVSRTLGYHELLSRVIMNCPDDKFVDHQGGELTRWDNRKTNLRIATVEENCRNIKIKSNNTSGVTGVTYHKRSGLWIARITYHKKRIHLGTFKFFEDAVTARKEAEEKYFGEWSYNNSQKLYEEKNKADEGEVQTT